MELIDKNLLREMICNLHCGLSEDNRLYIPLNEALRCVDSIPTIDPVKHGRLEPDGEDEVYCEWGICTLCGHDNRMGSCYCNKCGAKLDAGGTESCND